MDKELKEMTYKELKEINDRGEVDRSFLGYDIYKRNNYLGTITRINDENIIIDTSGCYRRKSNKPAKVG